METSGHSMFVAGDSLFLDAMGATNLDPTSKDRFSLYNYETVDTKGKVDPETGLRSGLGRSIDRDLPHAILKGKSILNQNIVDSKVTLLSQEKNVKKH